MKKHGEVSKKFQKTPELQNKLKKIFEAQEELKKVFPKNFWATKVSRKNPEKFLSLKKMQQKFPSGIGTAIKIVTESIAKPYFFEKWKSK